MENILFYMFAALAITSSILVVSLKNIVRALFLFFIVLFSMAGLFLFALADFVAITQILVYVGGVLILMLFAFMLSNKNLYFNTTNTSTWWKGMHWLKLLLAILFLIILLFGVHEFGQQQPEWIHEALANGKIIRSTDNNIQALGVHFMTVYILPLEIVSVFLMMALIGAAHLSRKEKTS